MCIRDSFQKVLVRMIVAKLPKEKKISIQESYTMTATDLVDLIGEENSELAELRSLEQLLAADKYDSPVNSRRRGGE